jgi:hypothetical protein
MRLKGCGGCFSLTRGWVLPNVGASPPGPLSEKEMRIKHFSGEPNDNKVDFKQHI